MIKDIFFDLKKIYFEFFKEYFIQIDIAISGIPNIDSQFGDFWNMGRFRLAINYNATHASRRFGNDQQGRMSKGQRDFGGKSSDLFPQDVSFENRMYTRWENSVARNEAGFYAFFFFHPPLSTFDKGWKSVIFITGIFIITGLGQFRIASSTHSCRSILV